MRGSPNTQPAVFHHRGQDDIRSNLVAVVWSGPLALDCGRLLECWSWGDAGAQTRSTAIVVTLCLCVIVWRCPSKLPWLGYPRLGMGVWDRANLKKSGADMSRLGEHCQSLDPVLPHCWTVQCHRHPLTSTQAVPTSALLVLRARRLLVPRPAL
ncbi:hypothetical protein OH77DRAFT_1420910 [Trametes cingulata]|nr:hypothetical protein OH77DRAFT_1420910 [Trametes cingulata]